MAGYIDSIDPTSPLDGDDPADFPAEMRAFKGYIKDSFENVDGAVTATDTEMNYLLGASVNVEQYGAAPGASAATNGAAFQAAVNTGALNIYIPEGTYTIDREINLNPAQTTLSGSKKGQTIWGAGQEKTIIESNSTSLNVFKFEPLDTADREMVFNCGIKSLTISNSNTQTTGVAVYLQQCSNFVLWDVGIEKFQTAILVAGGQLNSLSNFSIILYVNSSVIDTAGLLKFIATLKNDGVTYQDPFTTTVTNFRLQSNGKVQNNIRIDSCDALNFSNGYVSWPEKRCVHIVPANKRVLSVLFENIYFDGVLAGETAVQVATGTANDTNVLSFNHCIFGQFTGANTILFNDTIGNASISNSYIINNPGWGLLVNGTASTRISFTGNIVSEVGTSADASTGGVKLSVCDSNVVSGNTFLSCDGATSIGLMVAGAINNLSMADNSFINCTTDASITATVSGSLSKSGNTSDTAASTAMGMTLPNQSIADANTMDWYEEGYFDGDLAAGTGTITVDTSDNTFAYTRVGRVVLFQGRVLVDSVSTPSGTLQLTGLPFTAAALTENSDNAVISIRASALTGAVNAVHGRILESGTVVNIEEFTGTTIALMADHVQATTLLSFSGSYIAA